MTVYLHRFTGSLPAGDVFSFGWHDSTPNPLSSAHANAVNWITTVWAGSGVLLGIEGLYSTGVVVSRCATYALNSAFPYQTVAIAATDLTLAGTSLANALPQDVAVVCSLRTATPGRKGRGRLYLPGPTVSEVSATGELTTGAQSAIANGLSGGWGTVNPLGEQPVVFSRTAGTTLPVTQFGVGTVFDHQSRRVNKVTTVRLFEAMP